MSARGKGTTAKGTTAKAELDKLVADASPNQKNFFKSKDPSRVLLALHPVYRDKHMSTGLNKNWIKYCFMTGCKANEVWQSTKRAVTMWNGANVFHMGAATGITRPLMKVLQEFADLTPERSGGLMAATTENYSWSVLHFAAKYGRHNEIIMFLLKEPLMNVDARDNEQRTPLHRAAMSICQPDNSVPKGVSGRDAEQTVRVLLDYKADPNVVAITDASLDIADSATRTSPAVECLLRAQSPAPAQSAPPATAAGGVDVDEDGWTQVRAPGHRGGAPATTPLSAQLESDDNPVDWDTQSMKSLSPARSGCRTPIMDALMTITNHQRDPSEYGDYKGVLRVLLEATSRDLVRAAFTCVMARPELVGLTIACDLFLYPVDSAAAEEAAGPSEAPHAARGDTRVP